MSGVPASIPTDEEAPVLVADDDRDVRTMLRTLLELDGHEAGGSARAAARRTSR